MRNRIFAVLALAVLAGGGMGRTPITGQVMSMLVLVICVWLLTRGRRRENALSLSMGTHPIRLGLLTGVEVHPREVFRPLIRMAAAVRRNTGTVTWPPDM